MARSPSRPALLLSLAVALVACTAARSAEVPRGDDESYPADITPPPGTRYPCALTALPRDLAGVPPAERAYINHTYARILRATQAKLVILKALEDGAALDAALVRYREALDPLAERLRADTPPPGLEPFQSDVVAALGLQRAFFDQAVPQRKAGQEMAALYAIPEGRQASRRLIAAFGRMQARYPAWSAETKDSIYHHLCALDLF